MNAEQRAERRRRERARVRRQRRFAVVGSVVIVVLLVAAGARPWETSARRQPVAIASFVPTQYLGPLLRPDRGYHHRAGTGSREHRAIARFLALGYPIYCGGGNRRLVALTLDDGPAFWSSDVVDILRGHRARATFFLVGRQVLAFPSHARVERRAGVLGDHTWSHPYFNRLTRSAIKVEIENGRWALNHYARVPVALFRPPYGEHTAAVDEIVRSFGLLEILWSIDSRDYEGGSWRVIGRNVVSRLRPGAIVLMHEIHPQSIAALRRMHLRAVTVPELLAADPPSVSQLREGVRGCS